MIFVERSFEEIVVRILKSKHFAFKYDNNIKLKEFISIVFEIY